LVCNNQLKEIAMHDIDRIQVGREMETYEYPGGAGAGRVFNEQQEWELASELLEIGNEQEFEQFLGDLISKAGKAVGSFISSPTGQAVGGLLKSAAGKLLPMAGSAIGGYFGGPTGAKIGGQLAQTAGGMFGLEMESEEREWEAATTFVRLAGDTVKNAANAPAGANPVAVAQSALAQAAQVHAPGLVGPPAGAMGGPIGAGGAMGQGRSGRWIRRGGKIVLFGV
jgi:hypothetical protein